MRILIVSNTYPPADISGVGALVYELAHRFGDGGHRVRVITRVAPADDAYAVPAHGPKMLFPLFAAWSYLRLATADGYDIVHVHESDGCLVALWLRLTRLLRSSATPRLVATLQVTYVQERRAVRPVTANGKIVSTPTASERIFAWLRAPLHSALGRLTARLADSVVTASRQTATEIAEDYGVEPRVVIPNGVPRWLTREDCATAADLPDPDLGGRSPVVLFVGRLRTRKAVAVLLEGFAHLLEAAPGAQLILAGDGEHRATLERRAEALGITAATRFLGAVARAQLDPWYRAADIFCLPSTYEGFPVAILEAMAAGLPVVATSVSGIPEAIEDGVTGLLVEPEDASGLAQALGQLAHDAALRSEMGRNARRSLRQKFSIETVAAAYLEHFETLLPEASASR